MTETETDNFEYVSRVFKGLSIEKKDYVLNIARSLLEVQDGMILPMVGDKPEMVMEAVV